jgi:hypothetical protein
MPRSCRFPAFWRPSDRDQQGELTWRLQRRRPRRLRPSPPRPRPAPRRRPRRSNSALRHRWGHWPRENGRPETALSFQTGQTSCLACLRFTRCQSRAPPLAGNSRLRDRHLEIAANKPRGSRGKAWPPQPGFRAPSPDSNTRLSGPLTLPARRSIRGRGRVPSADGARTADPPA